MDKSTLEERKKTIETDYSLWQSRQKEATEALLRLEGAYNLINELLTKTDEKSKPVKAKESK